jgi:hypothetical protein
LRIHKNGETVKKTSGYSKLLTITLKVRILFILLTYNILFFFLQDLCAGVTSTSRKKLAREYGIGNGQEFFLVSFSTTCVTICALKPGPLGHLLNFLMPPSSRGVFRSREKQLIVLVLGTFSFICIGAIWFLPEKGAPGGKVKVVYDQIRRDVQEAAEGIILPPPPIGEQAESLLGNPNVRHGVIDRPDPHKVMEKANLDAQIELDQEIERIRYSDARL